MKNIIRRARASRHVDIAMRLQTSTWGFTPSQTIAPGLLAWELLDVGTRYETWLAWSSVLWTPVAAKVLRQDALSAGTRASLAREWETVRHLSHPGIVHPLDADVRDVAPLPYVAYEYVEGPTLDAVIDEHGPLTGPDVIRLGMQLAAALRYLHSQDLVHLDIKPGNVALVAGRPVLLDFDISLSTGELRSTTCPRGTPAYLAPEQVRCRPAAPSMDLFGLGVTLYEALTGRLPFEDEGSEHPQLSGIQVPAATYAPGTDPALDAVLSQLLQGDAARRPSSAAVVLKLLDAALPSGEEGTWPSWATLALESFGNDGPAKPDADGSSAARSPSLAQERCGAVSFDPSHGR
jgi:eukaryotic-like serine/threonine-protein kinase